MYLKWETNTYFSGIRKPINISVWKVIVGEGFEESIVRIDISDAILMLCITDLKNKEI